MQALKEFSLVSTQTGKRPTVSEFLIRLFRIILRAFYERTKSVALIIEQDDD